MRSSDLVTDEFGPLSEIGESQVGTRLFWFDLLFDMLLSVDVGTVVVSQFVCCWPRRPSWKWYGDVVMIL